MKILVIGSDRKLFEEDSKVVSRQVKYGKLVDRLDIIVFTKKNLDLLPKSLSGNVRVYPTNSRSRLLYIFDAIKIAYNLARPDMVSTQDPFESGIAGFLLASFFSLPFQIQIHTDFLSPYFFRESLLNKVRVFIAKFLIPRATRLRVVSNRIKRSIVDLRLKEAISIDVLPVFVDVARIKDYKPEIDLHEKHKGWRFIILMASRLTKEKNVGLAIDAMKIVLEKYPWVGMVVVGDGPEKENLKLQTTAHKLENNIVFEPWNNNLVSYYKTADLFLLTSNYEGYGMTVIEALGAGRPVAMTDVGCAGEMVRDGENGLVFGVGDRNGLVSALNKILLERSFWEKIKKGVQQSFSPASEDEFLVLQKKFWTDCVTADVEKVFSLKKMVAGKTEDSFVQFFRYFFVGLTAFSVDLFLLYVLTEYFSIYYLISSVFSFMAGLATNYVLSIRWIFSRGSSFNKYQEVLLFLLINVLGLFANAFIIWFSTEIFGLYYIVSKFFSTAVVFFWNFLARKYILYK